MAQRLKQTQVNTAGCEDEVSALLHGSMRKKLDQIVLAIDGITTPLQRRLLAQVVDHIDDMTRRISDLL